MTILRHIAVASIVLIAGAAPALAQQGAVPQGALTGPVFSMPPNGPAAPPPPRRPGDDVMHAYVEGLQRGLPAHGYHAGPPTGHLDPATEQAILAYQRDAGLPQDVHNTAVLKQTLDSVTFARPPIFAGAAPPPPAPLAPPSPEAPPPPEVAPPPEAPAAPTNSLAPPPPTAAIRAVQTRLKTKGYDVDVTGTLDVYTVNAIKAFEMTNGLPRDGQISPPLMEKLNE